MKRTFLCTLWIVAATTLFAAQKLPPMTNQDVIDMVRTQMDTTAIIKVIERSTPAFDLTDDGVNQLTGAGVSDTLLTSMRQANSRTTNNDIHVEPGPTSDGVLTNHAIIAMSQGGLDDDVIVAAIHAAEVTEFKTDYGTLMNLRGHGISSAVLTAMIGASETHGAKLSKDASPDAPQGGQQSEASSHLLASEVRRLEQQVAQLQTQREQIVSEIRRANNSRTLNNFSCDKSSLLGRINCLSADLNGRVASSGVDRLREIELKIADTQKQLFAARDAAGRDPLATSLLLKNEGSVAPKMPPDLRMPTPLSRDATERSVLIFDVTDTTINRHLFIGGKGVLKIGVGRLEWTNPKHPAEQFICPITEVTLRNPKMEGGYYIECASGSGGRFRGHEGEVFEAVALEKAAVRQ
jgi:outer membrane murein-binding lipoprotein Lpp